MRKYVLPGDLLFEKPVRIKNTFIEDGKTYAASIGFLEKERFVPLKSIYKPEIGDNIVGFVLDVRPMVYSIDVNMPTNAFLLSRETSIRLRIGDFIFGKVKRVDEVGTVELTDIRRLPRGKLIEFPTAKVPRLIGKQSSMINMIRRKTQTKIYVGNNGYIWIDPKGKVPKILKVFDMIIKGAHTKGLTDRVSKFLGE